jgi:hypothetical protein
LTVYWSVWIGVAGCKFAVYAGLAFFIYQGRADGIAAYTSAAALGGLDRLKNRVVFTFAFLEMMFWFWVSAINWEGSRSGANIDILQSFSTLRQERQERLTKLLEDTRDL